MAEYHIKGAKTKRLSCMEKYLLNPRLCKNCGKIIMPKEHESPNSARKKKYCNLECLNEYRKIGKLRDWLSRKITKIHIGTTKNHYVRKYIRNKQGNVCSICNNPPIWNNKDIVFVLDHIDGNSENCNEDNLRLICPNCDSQLPTYKGKNMGNGRFKRMERYKKGKSF